MAYTQNTPNPAQGASECRVRVDLVTARPAVDGRYLPTSC